MNETTWTVALVGQAKKAPRNLSPIVLRSLATLLEELKKLGAQRHEWPHFGKLGPDTYHCHLKSGRPTYVACWKVFKKAKLIEVYYAGTHEKAPY